MAATVWVGTDLQLFIHAKHPPLSRAESSHASVNPILHCQFPLPFLFSELLATSLLLCRGKSGLKLFSPISSPSSVVTLGLGCYKARIKCCSEAYFLVSIFDDWVTPGLNCLLFKLPHGAHSRIKVLKVPLWSLCFYTPPQLIEGLSHRPFLKRRVVLPIPWEDSHHSPRQLYALLYPTAVSWQVAMSGSTWNTLELE